MIVTHSKVLTSEEYSTLRTLLYQAIFRVEDVAFGMRNEEDSKKAINEIEKNYLIIDKLINMEKQNLKENAYDFLEHTS